MPDSRERTSGGLGGGDPLHDVDHGLPRSVPFNALAPSLASIRTDIDAAIARVLDRAYFLMGPEGEAFEQAFAAYHGPDFQAVGVGSGTDALRIGLQALGVQPGDEVLVPANAGVPPVAAVVAAGARPVFCDVDEGHNLDPGEIDRRASPRTRAVLVVHLYGRPAEMDGVLTAARAHGMRVLEDCAQAHGARYRGRLAGTMGDAAAFSFYPTKNLGALGDAGAVMSDDSAVVEQARLLRQYGWRQKYLSERHSTVSRLDELQAAVLGVKLPLLDAWNGERRALAAAYLDRLRDCAAVRVDQAPAHLSQVHHLFVVRAERREALRAFLADRGVATDVHYPYPVHLQAPYAHYGEGQGSLPRTERLAAEVLSLPLYPGLSKDDVAYVAEQVKAFPGRSPTSDQGKRRARGSGTR